MRLTELNVGYAAYALDDQRMSVWEDVASIGNYVFNTVHAHFHDRKEGWFQAMTSHHFVMWMVEGNHTPGLAEAIDRLEYLQNTGRQTTPLAGISSIKALGGAAH
jgi:Iap family predicted aminopeptidase